MNFTSLDGTLTFKQTYNKKMLLYKVNTCRREYPISTISIYHAMDYISNSMDLSSYKDEFKEFINLHESKIGPDVIFKHLILTALGQQKDKDIYAESSIRRRLRGFYNLIKHLILTMFGQKNKGIGAESIINDYCRCTYELNGNPTSLVRRWLRGFCTVVYNPKDKSTPKSKCHVLYIYHEYDGEGKNEMIKNHKVTCKFEASV